MKRLTLLFSLFLAFAMIYPQEYTPWKWLHPKPQGLDLRWVKMWDANTWYAVGYEGTFMKTTDSGQTWFFHHTASVPLADHSQNNLFTALFFDQNTGIVAGVDGAMRTTDGGASFYPLAVPMSTSGTVYGSYMLNDSVGYVAGSSSIHIQRTTDAGLTWTELTGVGATTSYDICSPDDTLMIVASTSGNIRRSTDGGISFATINVGASFTIEKLAFKDKNGWAVGTSGNAFLTTDAGLTWTNKSAGLPTTSFYDVDFRMAGTTEQVVLTGNSYDLYATTDMGTTWTQIDFLGPYADQPWTDTYYSTDFLNDKFVTVGGTGLINSRVGEATPVAHTTWMKAGTVYDIWVENPNGKIIAVGAKGNTTNADQVMYSTNGGQDWSKGTSNCFSTVRTIDMVNSNLGYFSAYDGAIFKTTNGGVSWDSLVTPLPTTDFYGIDFVDETTGWAVGTTGKVLKTTDGGAAWAEQTSGETVTLYSISMVDANTGWFCGSSGNVRKTTDGGLNWVEQTTAIGTSTCYMVDAVTNEIAYIAAASGKVGKTTNGGTSWSLLTLPADWGTSTVYALEFRDENYGLVGGSASKAAVTTDGGAAWSMGYANNSTIYGVGIAQTGTDTTSAYVVGTSGSVLVNNLFVVPVELSSFTANVSGNSVQLSWSTATESNNYGFAIERMGDNSLFEQIAFIPGKGTSTEISKYSFIDENLQKGNYAYRLKQIDFNGSFSYSDDVEVEVSLPSVFSLDQNYPNPFNPSTVIKYSIPSSEFVTLALYNSLGEKVSTLVNRMQEAGSYQITFDASKLAAGVYVYKIQAGSFISAKKMMLIK